MKRDDVLDFFTQLDRLPKGDRTALKREAGMMLHEADGRAIQAFYKCMLPTIPERLIQAKTRIRISKNP